LKLKLRPLVPVLMEKPRPQEEEPVDDSSLPDPRTLTLVTYSQPAMLDKQPAGPLPKGQTRAKINMKVKSKAAVGSKTKASSSSSSAKKSTTSSKSKTTSSNNTPRYIPGLPPPPGSNIPAPSPVPNLPNIPMAFHSPVGMVPTSSTSLIPTNIPPPAPIEPNPNVPMPGGHIPLQPIQSSSISKKKRKHLRAAAGKVWEDKTLEDWPENDFRIFCGDLGNEVNDNTLAKAFVKFPSFSKAKVIRDKRTQKTKGFGFVSFLDPFDCARALKEMAGKYIGNRPVKLRRSIWDRRALRKKKETKEG